MPRLPCALPLVLPLLLLACGSSVAPDSGISTTPPAPVVCAGTHCADGQVCCYATGECIDRSATTCPRPTPAPAGEPASCSSDADCAAGEFCTTDTCLGDGHCQPRDVCFGARCEPAGDPACQVCGCDGRTYANECAVQAAGVRMATRDPCGTNTIRNLGPDGTCSETVTSCTTDADCSNGLICCQLLGRCYDSSRPAFCAAPPPGSQRACSDNSMCMQHLYCAGNSCSDIGGCVPMPSTVDCGGAVQQVCGCDGITYTNTCWANAAGTRVASQGACP